jgi:hypothetical protein
VGGAQPDRQEMTVRGTAKSRRVSEFYKDSESNGLEFIPLREEQLLELAYVLFAFFPLLYLQAQRSVLMA